jgi:hypothetical protein
MKVSFHRIEKTDVLSHLEPSKLLAVCACGSCSFFPRKKEPKKSFRNPRPTASGQAGGITLVEVPPSRVPKFRCVEFVFMLSDKCTRTEIKPAGRSAFTHLPMISVACGV